MQGRYNNILCINTIFLRIQPVFNIANVVFFREKNIRVSRYSFYYLPPAPQAVNKGLSAGKIETGCAPGAAGIPVTGFMNGGQ